MKWLRRLMEIKETQLRLEQARARRDLRRNQLLINIIRELKGGKRKWKK